MTDQTLEIQIIRYLRLLESTQQLKVLDYIKSLTQPKESPNAALLKFAGAFDEASIKEMEEAIESDCETIWEDA